jgi:uroporphyrinogen decarboxylase
MRVPMQNPSPDFDELAGVLKGEKKPEKVHFVELGVDAEVAWAIAQDYLNLEQSRTAQNMQERYLSGHVEFYHRMGYDFVPLWCSWRNMPKFRERRAADTAVLSRGERSWVEEGGGIIKNWEDFERLGWDNITHDLSSLEYVRRILPDGMRITVGDTLFEAILERFLGYQDLFLFSHDNPKLVEGVFQQWGQKVEACYREAVECPELGAIFHADDLGHKTGTLLSPAFLRKNVFPWFARYASLAHEAGKMYWYHCCGNVLEVMEDLIERIGIDAFHSFQDVIIPAGEFLNRYGDRMAALGGIDMDKLARLAEPELRAYARDALAQCMPGRYALGSGNTIANYIPPENYLIMLDEGLAWRP